MNELTSPSAEELKAFRKHHLATQAALASHLGVSARAVEEWESGRREAPPMLRLALAAIAGSLAPWSMASLPSYSVRTYERIAGAGLLGVGSAPLSAKDDDEATLQAYRFARTLQPGHVVALINPHGQQMGLFESTPFPAIELGAIYDERRQLVESMQSMGHGSPMYQAADARLREIDALISRAQGG